MHISTAATDNKKIKFKFSDSPYLVEDIEFLFVLTRNKLGGHMNEPALNQKKKITGHALPYMREVVHRTLVPVALDRWEGLYTHQYDQPQNGVHVRGRDPVLRPFSPPYTHGFHDIIFVRVFGH